MQGGKCKINKPIFPIFAGWSGEQGSLLLKRLGSVIIPVSQHVNLHFGTALVSVRESMITIGISHEPH